MRIYSDILTNRDVRWALADAHSEAPSVSFVDLDSIDTARKRKWRHDVALYGWGARHTRRRNPGTAPYHLDSIPEAEERAATWMDWGWLIAVLFRYDPAAIIGQYNGIADFHAQTSGRTLAHRLRIDPSVKNFARECAAIWDRETSPFLLVDRLCPPKNLVNLAQREQVETWLEMA